MMPENPNQFDGNGKKPTDKSPTEVNGGRFSLTDIII